MATDATETNEDALRALAIAIQTPGVSKDPYTKQRRLGLPVLLWGPPGVGKTAFVENMAERLGYYFVTVLASVRTPDDFLGIPVPDQMGLMESRKMASVQRTLDSIPGARALAVKSGRDPASAKKTLGAILKLNIALGNRAHIDPDPTLTYIRTGGVPTAGAQTVPPQWAVDIVEASRRGKRSLLFLDEFSTATPAVQSALLRVVHERVVGDLLLPADVAVVAAANPPFMSPGGSDLEPPTVNRFIHVQWGPPSKELWGQYITGEKQPLLDTLPTLDENDFALQYARVAAKGAQFMQDMTGSVLKTQMKKAAGLATGQKTAGMVFDENAPLFNMPTKSAMTALQKTEATFHAYNYAWPSPRSWEIALRAHAACLAAGVQSSVTGRMVCGSVGSPLCRVWAAWLLRNNPSVSPERLLSGASYTPKNVSDANATLNAVLHYGLTKGRMREAVEWIKRNSPEGGGGLLWDWIVMAAQTVKQSGEDSPSAPWAREAINQGDALERWANARMEGADDEFAPAGGTGAGVY